MPQGFSKKVSENFKKQASLEKTIEEIGLSDVKDAVVKTNQFLQKLCVYVYRWVYKDFNGDFDILWDIVDDLDSKDDELLLSLVKRILALSLLNNISFSCDSFKEFVKEQADLEDAINGIK